MTDLFEPGRRARHRSRSATSICLVALALCSCRDAAVPEGPPPPQAPEKPYQVSVLRLGGKTEVVEPSAGSLKNGMKTFQFTEGSYYKLDVIDLKGDLGAASDELDTAVRGGADVVVVTHPDILRATAGRQMPKPVVFAILSDPSSPGGEELETLAQRRITGVYNPLPTSAVLELLKHYLPHAKRVGVVFNQRDPVSAAHKDAMIRNAVGGPLEIVAEGFDGGDGLSAATDALLGRPVDALCLVAGLDPSLEKIIQSAGRTKTPVFGFRAAHVRAGALAAQVQEPDWVGIEAGKVVCQILLGQTPKDLPARKLVDTVTFVNPRAAKEQGVTLPPGALRNARSVEGP
jgi:putative ABC transport system substrate-binding protein